MTDLLMAFLGLCLFVQIGSVAVAILRLARPVATGSDDGEGVSILRPVCGTENNLEATLRSVMRLDHPRYEVLFCVALADDPAVPLCRAVMAAHPACDARLLIGDERIGANPKLNNLVKGWAAAKYDRIVMSDSNVLAPPSYLSDLAAPRDAGTAFVCSPPLGTAADGFAAAVEQAFLNTHQARWQLLADAFGMAFVQGKTIAMRRSEVEAMGGLATLSSEPAEDAAATKAARRAGRAVRLTRRPFAQPLGRRKMVDVWRRQVRWARLRRASFPLMFLPELLTGIVPAVLAGLLLVAMGGLSPAIFAAFVLLWYAAEYALARAYGWPLGRFMPAALMLRDLLLPAVWLSGWVGDGFVWRGNAMTTETDETLAEAIS